MCRTYNGSRMDHPFSLAHILELDQQQGKLPSCDANFNASAWKQEQETSTRAEAGARAISAESLKEGIRPYDPPQYQSHHQRRQQEGKEKAQAEYQQQRPTGAQDDGPHHHLHIHTHGHVHKHTHLHHINFDLTGLQPSPKNLGTSERFEEDGPKPGNWENDNGASWGSSRSGPTYRPNYETLAPDPTRKPSQVSPYAYSHGNDAANRSLNNSTLGYSSQKSESPSRQGSGKGYFTQQYLGSVVEHNVVTHTESYYDVPVADKLKPWYPPPSSAQDGRVVKGPKAGPGMPAPAPSPYTARQQQWRDIMEDIKSETVALQKTESESRLDWVAAKRRPYSPRTDLALHETQTLPHKAREETAIAAAPVPFHLDRRYNGLPRQSVTSQSRYGPAPLSAHASSASFDWVAHQVSDQSASARGCIAQTFDQSASARGSIAQSMDQSPSARGSIVRTADQPASVRGSVANTERRGSHDSNASSVRSQYTAQMAESTAGSSRLYPIVPLPGGVAKTGRARLLSAGVEAYLQRRKKNNDAVQKCRQKKREYLQHWQQVCDKLTDERKALLGRRKALQIQLTTLREKAKALNLDVTPMPSSKHTPTTAAASSDPLGQPRASPANPNTKDKTHSPTTAPKRPKREQVPGAEGHDADVENHRQRDAKLAAASEHRDQGIKEWCQGVADASSGSESSVRSVSPQKRGARVGPNGAASDDSTSDFSRTMKSENSYLSRMPEDSDIGRSVGNGSEFATSEGSEGSHGNAQCLANGSAMRLQGYWRGSEAIGQGMAAHSQHSR